MNKKGQALVEFVLILPVFILLVFAFIDIGKIILCKNQLETSMNDAVLMIRNNEDLETIKKVLNENSDYTIKIDLLDGEYTKIVLKTEIDLVTPGMSRIFSENISVERSILYE